MKRVSRVVTLPDWQGIGVSFALLDEIGAAYGGAGQRFRMYPSHPPFIASFRRSPRWRIVKEPGHHSAPTGDKSTIAGGRTGAMGGSACAVFEYVGPAMSAREGLLLIGRG